MPKFRLKIMTSAVADIYVNSPNCNDAAEEEEAESKCKHRF